MVMKNGTAIFAGLLNGQYDGVASGVTVTEERKQTIDFSTTYATVGQVVLVPTESSLTGIDDLAGKAVGVQIGTTGDLALDEYDTNTKRYDDITLAVKDMINGNLDACVCDSLIASKQPVKKASGKIEEAVHQTENHHRPQGLPYIRLLCKKQYQKGYGSRGEQGYYEKQIIVHRTAIYTSFHSTGLPYIDMRDNVAGGEILIV
uniref:Solute-binding protein family 3/N-terminal domain-containing protein n=1 Tax=uncultured prokaryote TaxID=198431 RepID=A0A0H5Q761_9ZZZZ|nr:hypothetical protein [uncultured prokaryote]